MPKSKDKNRHCLHSLYSIKHMLIAQNLHDTFDAITTWLSTKYLAIHAPDPPISHVLLYDL